MTVPANTTVRLKVGAVFRQRCFYLFMALALLLAAAPMLVENQGGRIAANVINLTILVAAVAAVGRSRAIAIFSLLLLAATAVSEMLALVWDEARFLPLSWNLSAVLYFLTICYLLSYVLRPSVLDTDKLFGAAAIYLMMGVFWGYIYTVIEYFLPGAFSLAGRDVALAPIHLLYYSFTVLTTVGFGDVVPVFAPARSATMVQEVSGVLYIAILIARLTGAYPSDRAAR
jgi:hypothetical protein